MRGVFSGIGAPIPEAGCPRGAQGCRCYQLSPESEPHAGSARPLGGPWTSRTPHTPQLPHPPSKIVPPETLLLRSCRGHSSPCTWRLEASTVLLGGDSSVRGHPGTRGQGEGVRRRARGTEFCTLGQRGAESLMEQTRSSRSTAEKNGVVPIAHTF